MADNCKHGICEVKTLNKDSGLDEIIKLASSNPQQRKTQRRFRRASSDSESSEDDSNDELTTTTTLSRDQALRLSLNKKIEQRQIKSSSEEKSGKRQERIDDATVKRQ